MTGRRTGARPRTLPLRRGRETLLLLAAFAVMAFVAGLAAVGLLVVGRGEAAWRRAFAATMTLEVPADASPARLETVLALLKQTPGVAAVRQLTLADEARLLEPWLGPGARLDGLPVPRLIDLRTAPGGVDLAALRDKLFSVVPEAKLDDHEQLLDRVRRAARRARIVLTTGIAAALLAVAPTATFAARAAAAANRPLIDLARRLGAVDRDITRPLVLRFFRLALVGGAIGGFGVGLTLAALAPLGAFARQALLTSVAPTDWRLSAIVAATALATGLVAAAAAQASLARQLAERP